MTIRTKGFLLGAISAAAYGVNPLALFMYEDGMTTDSVLACRYILAAVLMAGLMVFRRESFSLTFKECVQLMILGMLFSLSSIFLFMSYRYIDVSIASTLLFCYPAMVAVIMILLFKERPSLLTIVSLVLVGIGVVMLNSDGGSSVDSLMGVMFVIISSLQYAVYIVCVQKTSLAKMSSLKVGFYSIAFGSLLYVVRLNMLCDLQLPSTMRSVVCAAILAVFPTLISLVALAAAIRHIGSTSTAILGALEPVTAVLIGVIVFSERPSIIAIMGMLVIFGAVTLLLAAPKLEARRRAATNNM